MKLSLLCNNKKSWAVSYIEAAMRDVWIDQKIRFIQENDQVPEGDVCFLISCTKIVPPSILKRNTLNMVVHASDLPKGRGSAPIQWQILEGKNKIPIKMITAAEKVDEGDIYYESEITFKGTELLNEIRDLQWAATEKLIQQFLDQHPNHSPKIQSGEPSYYSPRKRVHDKLDPSKTLSELFNQLRIADNDKYPAFFEYLGTKYLLKIEKSQDDE